MKKETRAQAINNSYEDMKIDSAKNAATQDDS